MHAVNTADRTDIQDGADVNLVQRIIVCGIQCKDRVGIRSSGRRGVNNAEPQRDGADEGPKDSLRVH